MDTGTQWCIASQSLGIPVILIYAEPMPKKIRAGNMGGYAAVGLDSPKSAVNVGSAMRAVGVYGAAFLAFSGKRVNSGSTDAMRHYLAVPLLQVDELRSVIPYDCVPVAVDRIEGATPLWDYEHPKRAFYIFGPEDSSLGKRIISFCRDVIIVPTNGPMNLAATVNVVLYDRMAKQMTKPKW